MSRVKVPVAGTVGKAVHIDTTATNGAVIGDNLKMPDGSTATLAKLKAALGSTTTTTGPRGGSQVSFSDWSLISDIPSNVSQLAALSDAAGVLTNDGSGALSWGATTAFNVESINIGAFSGTFAVEGVAQ